MVEIPKEGEKFTFEKTVGYVPYQNRPFAHRVGEAEDGHVDPPYNDRCSFHQDGQTVRTEATVVRVIYWMDNSVEVVGKDLDGGMHSQLVVAPHGDIC